MKYAGYILPVILLGFANLVFAGDDAKFVSKTFQEIQSRVVKRDAECNAILTVKVKEDAPGRDFGLAFTIEDAGGGEAVVVISERLMTGDGIFEKYRLRMDDAMRQELKNQQKLKELEADRATKAIEEEKKNITELSGGKLSYGMSLEEVTKVKGKPTKVENWQAVGAFTAFYPDANLNFWDGKLTHMERKDK